MLFFFGQCNGGGMINDLMEVLSNTGGDAAFFSAARHNQSAWIGKPYPKGWKNEVSVAFNMHGSPSAATIAKNVFLHEPYRHKEKNQFTTLGRGAEIAIGKRADGTAVQSIHAIIYYGRLDAPHRARELKIVYRRLKRSIGKKSITVLAGLGKHNWGHAFIQGPGTARALENALRKVARKMNSNEQFIFFAGDHGGPSEIAEIKRPTVLGPGRHPIVPVGSSGSKWKLTKQDEKGMTNQDHTASLSLYVADEVGGPTCADLGLNLMLEFNGRSLPGEADDQLPGVCQTWFELPANAIKKNNRISVSWENRASFRPFFISAAALGWVAPEKLGN